MTSRQRTMRINTLRKEYRRLLLAGRTVTANKLARELTVLVVDKLREEVSK